MKRKGNSSIADANTLSYLAKTTHPGKKYAARALEMTRFCLPRTLVLCSKANRMRLIVSSSAGLPGLARSLLSSLLRLPGQGSTGNSRKSTMTMPVSAPRRLCRKYWSEILVGPSSKLFTAHLGSMFSERRPYSYPKRNVDDS
jgi:hypothetical protein